MSTDFKLFPYEEYLRRINKIVGVVYNSTEQDYVSKDPDIVQELLLSLVKFEDKIIKGNSSITGKNLILYIEGFIKKTYKGKLKKNFKRVPIVDKELSTFEIEDERYSEDNLINKICLDEIIKKSKLTEDETEFLSYHKLKVKKKEIMKELNLTLKEYDTKKHALFNKLSRNKDWSSYN